MRTSLNLLLLAFILISSSALPAQETLAPEAWEKQLHDRRLQMEGVKRLNKRTIPLLHAPELEQAWGTPQISASNDGGYSLIYTAPNNSLEILIIYGFARPFPQLSEVPHKSTSIVVNEEIRERLVPQEWQVAPMILRHNGQTQRLAVKYYHVDEGSGADSPMDSTDTFTISLENQTGYYVVMSGTMGTSDTTAKRLEALAIR